MPEPSEPSGPPVPLDRPGAILLDIEGTTGSIAFVADTLFPYARRHLRAYVATHAAMVEPLLEEVRAAEPGDPVDTLLRWMDEDRKATPLKALQGMIWAGGYADGSLRGHVYADAIAALRRWREAGIPVFIYSSGSVPAQKLLFGHSIAGDLSPLLAGYFDTTVGAKTEPASYAAIAVAIGVPSGAILFLSDAPAEVAAARAAGLPALRVDRDGRDGDIADFEGLDW